MGLNTQIPWDQVTIEGPVYIGASVRVESGASIIGPSWIGHGSRIRNGAKVVRGVEGIRGEGAAPTGPGSAPR